MKKIYIIMLAIVLLIPALGGCGGRAASETASAPESSAVTAEISEEASAVEAQSTDEAPTVISEAVPVIEDIVITTDYGDLHYPEQWTNLAEITTAVEEEAIKVTFEAPIGDTKYFLFAVVIGGEEGVPAGELTGPDGVVRSVNLIVEEIVEIPELTEGEQNRLYAMQEDLNYIIENLK